MTGPTEALPKATLLWGIAMPSGITKNPTSTETSAPPDLGLLTPRQLAKELSMCVRTLQRLHDNKIGPPRITLGKHIFYRFAAVNQWLARSEGYTPVRPLRNARRARRVRATA